MYAVRIHGRGGQGVVTSAELLALAAFVERRHAQAFPSFGSERTGAPVAAFCRIDDRPIRTREPIVAPDAVVVADPTLLHQVDVLQGLRPGGYLLINTARPVEELALPAAAARPCLVPASDLARQYVGRPWRRCVRRWPVRAGSSCWSGPSRSASAGSSPPTYSGWNR